MAGPFVVESGVPGTQVWSVDFSGNTVQSGNLVLSSTSTLVNPGIQQFATATVTGLASIATASIGTGSINAGTITTLTTTGVITQNSGINSAGSINVITPTFGVSAASGTQLTDTTRDYMVYLTTSAGGANNTLTIGVNATATGATIFASATVGTGQLMSFRLPAGWFVRYQGAQAIGAQAAVSC